MGTYESPFEVNYYQGEKSVGNSNQGIKYGCKLEQDSLMRANVFKAANDNYPKTYRLGNDIYSNGNVDGIGNNGMYDEWHVPNIQKSYNITFTPQTLNKNLELALFVFVMVLTIIIAILSIILTKF